MRKLKRLAPQVAALVLVLIAVTLAAPGFLSLSFQNGRVYGSLIDVGVRAAPVALLAIGMTLVIATKGIDLSVGAVMAITGAVAASLVANGQPLAVVILVSLGIGLLCGLWNGALVAILDLQPIIATLILMVAGRGIAQLITEGTILTFNNPAFSFIGSGAFLGLPMPILIWLAVGLAVGLLVRRSALGLLIEAVGINRRASSLIGVRSRFLIIAAYAVSGLCAAMAGMIVTADIHGADANNAGLWLELDAILAVVIGGTSLSGGRFSITASLIGALIIQTLNTGILMAGWPPEFNLIVKAVAIVIILTLQSPTVATLIGGLRIAARSGGTQKHGHEKAGARVK